MVILIGVLGIVLAQVGLFLWGYRAITRYVEHKLDAISAAAAAEIMALVKDEPCQAATVLLAIGKTVGREAGRSAKAAIFQEAGVAQRLGNAGGEDQVIDGIAAKQPGIGAVLAGMSRGQKKGLLGNPLIQLALQGLAGSGGGAPAAQPGNNEHRSSYSL